MKKLTTLLLLPAGLVLSGWYVSCDSTDQLPIRAYKGELWDTKCTGEGEEYANLAFFEARDCMEDLGVLAVDWEQSHTDLRICVTPEPFVCPGLSWTVAECGGVVAGGEAFTLVSKSWTSEEYDFRSHVRLGVLNLLIWLGHSTLPPMSEGELRETEEYWKLIGCMEGRYDI